MKMYEGLCHRCVCYDNCTRREKNQKYLGTIKVPKKHSISICDLPDSLNVKIECDMFGEKFVEELFHQQAYCIATRAESFITRPLQWSETPPKCFECRYNSLCKVDKEKQEIACETIKENLEGTVLFSCSCYLDSEEC